MLKRNECGGNEAIAFNNCKLKYFITESYTS